MTERVQAINPIYGMRINTGYDPLAKGYDASALIKAINAISDSRHNYDMLMEAARFDEVDSYYNPGTEEVADDFVLEAIVVDKFSKTERRMAAVVRVLNKHLAGSEINALEAIIGKPKKTGSYAYVTVQLPFSDGQVVSVIFHAPEGDKKKIGPSDQIIAFRWLLNKRDITQVVAPEDGSEISLESLATRITQLVIKNSARFERTQKEAQAERQELDKAREALKEAEERQNELMDTLGAAAKDAESIEAQLSNTLAQLEKQKGINAELEARLDAMRKTQGGGTSGNSAGTGIDNNDSAQQVKEYKNYTLGSKEGMKHPLEIKFTISRPPDDFLIKLRTMPTNRARYNKLHEEARDELWVKQQNQAFRNEVELNQAFRKGIDFGFFSLSPRRGYYLATFVIDTEGQPTGETSAGKSGTGNDSATTGNSNSSIDNGSVNSEGSKFNPDNDPQGWMARLHSEAGGEDTENVDPEKIAKARRLIEQISQFGTETGFAFTDSTERFSNFYSGHFGNTISGLRWDLSLAQSELTALNNGKRARGMTKKEARDLLSDRIKKYSSTLEEALSKANERYDAYIAYLEKRLEEKKAKAGYSGGNSGVDNDSARTSNSNNNKSSGYKELTSETNGASTIEAQEQKEGEKQEMRKALIAATDGLVSEEDIERQEGTLIDFMEDVETYRDAKFSRDDIFRMFSNTPVPIATMPSAYLKYFDKADRDPKVYCGKAYFVDHATNHHPEIETSEYENIQNVLSSPDEVIEESKKGKTNLIFVKKMNGTRGLVVEIREGEDGKAVLYKTWMPTREKPYPKLPRITPVSVGGVSTISRSDNNQNPAVSLSALDTDKSNLNSLPAFVNDLNDILAGKYDGDTDKIDKLLDETASDAEKSGMFAAYEDLFNQAADHLTELLKEKAAKVL